MPRRKSAAPVSRKKTTKSASSIDLYRKVVISFAVLTSILIILVLYFSFVSTKITVIPRPEKITADFTVNVVEAEDGLVPDEVNGIFFDKEVEGEKEFTATGSKSISSDIVGRVSVINEYRRPQPLVATTRLLSVDNVLLRTKERVDVPVGGTIEVDVYADDPGQLQDRTLPAGTRFIIPGIWPQLQDKIYAESTGVIALGESKVSIVTKEDIDRATAELLDQLKLQAFVDLGLDGNIAKVVDVEEPEVTISAKEGDEVTKFSVKIKASVRGVLFDKESLLHLAEERMRSSLPKDKQLLNTNVESLQYEVEELDLEQKRAIVEVHLEGVSVLRLNSDIFDKDRIKGLSKEQVMNYFTSQSSIESVSVKFFPFWVNRVPQLNDHINLIVK